MNFATFIYPYAEYKLWFSQFFAPHHVSVFLFCLEMGYIS